MILSEHIQRFIVERNVEDFGKSQLGANGVLTRFTLAYYDTYALLALTKKNILYLDEEVLQEVKIHKNKLYFTISYDTGLDAFELDRIIYGVPLQKCIRVVTAVKKILTKHSLGSQIENFTVNKSTHTSVTLTKLSL